jgi:site-specific recombinase XerD
VVFLTALAIKFSSDLKQSQVLSGPNGVLMKANLRYQNGSLYRTAWCVVCPIPSRRISEQDGSTNLNRVSKYLGRSKDFRSISDVERSRASFMQTVSRNRLSANSRITLTAFVVGAYLPWTKEERRASTSKSHHEIWTNHIRDHVGELHLREFRTVDASLPLLEKSLVATAALAGLRQGELRGLEWTDYTGTELVVKRSIWMSVVNPPKTRASRDSVPVIPALAEILDEYRKSMGSPETSVVFRSGDGLPICVDKVGRRVIRRALETMGLPWYGWHAFRRGLASNLYEIGAQDKVVQRILRHSKPHVTRERYIKVFGRTVLDAVEKIQGADRRIETGERRPTAAGIEIWRLPECREPRAGRFSALLSRQATI